MKRKYNVLKLQALTVFEGRGWLSVPAWAVLASFYPVRASYSYLKRLYRWRLLERTLDRRGLLLYRLSDQGARRLIWLRANSSRLRKAP
jgi:hypothetical protein